MDDFGVDIDLSDFFSAVNEEKKKKKEEFDSLISNSFDEFFLKPLKEEASTISKEKEKKKKEVDYLIGNIDLNSLFEDISLLKKENKEKKKEIKNQVELFEKWLYSEQKSKKQKQNKKVTKEEEEVIQEIKEEETKKTLQEKSLGLLAEPSDIKVKDDPLTPLDQNFATKEDLQKHYKIFLERIQQQLSTIGGGGEYRFRFLDGLVGIKTNPDGYGNKFLQWNSATYQAEFVNINAVQTDNIVLITGITTYYQATNENDYIGVSADVPVLIDLPTSPVAGKKITVKDEGNKISTYNITVRAGVGASVENSDSVIMKVNHESFTYFYNGYNWYIV